MFSHFGLVYEVQVIDSSDYLKGIVMINGKQIEQAKRGIGR